MERDSPASNYPATHLVNRDVPLQTPPKSQQLQPKTSVSPIGVRNLIPTLMTKHKNPPKTPPSHTNFSQRHL